jgi:hypothetical protein
MRAGQRYWNFSGLAPSTRFGLCEILSALGPSGMGEVYRARDSKLRCEVAIKVLPDALPRLPGSPARLRPR